MVWCFNCDCEVDCEVDDASGISCCVQCGRVLEEATFATDVQFTKGADGEGEMVGQFVGAEGHARGSARYSGGRLWAGGVSAS